MAKFEKNPVFFNLYFERTSNVFFKMKTFKVAALVDICGEFIWIAKREDKKIVELYATFHQYL